MYPVYKNSFFGDAETSFHSTFDENIPSRHSPVSNDEPVNNENFTVERTSSMDRPLCQQSFEAWMSATDSTLIHEYDKGRDRAVLTRAIKSAFSWFKRKSMFTLIKDLVANYHKWKSIIQWKSNEVTQMHNLRDRRIQRQECLTESHMNTNRKTGLQKLSKFKRMAIRKGRAALRKETNFAIKRREERVRYNYETLWGVHATNLRSFYLTNIYTHLSQTLILTALQ